MTVWVIGGGKFGSRAVTLLLQTQPDAHITLVDPSPKRPAPWRQRIETVADDGVAYLTRQLKTRPLPDWIIPAAPIHVAYRWAIENAGVRLETIPIPADCLTGLPNAVRGESGAVYTSFADFRCPEDCVEPTDRCTVTGRPRREDMVTRFERLARPGRPCIVVRSHLLFPGVGGYAPRALLDMKHQIKNMAGGFLLGTACRCHGVLHALDARPIPSSR